MDLTKEENEMLQWIAKDKYAIGPFAGMIFNAMNTSDKWTGLVGQDKEWIRTLVRRALLVRRTIDEMASVGGVGGRTE